MFHSDAENGIGADEIGGCVREGFRGGEKLRDGFPHSIGRREEAEMKEKKKKKKKTDPASGW